ncbi:hypothetical protein [Archangium violaceum]|uniref:hypothetical protein n=1 Tax=Archangium violaceum TaxID=83451 RepID=UPI0036D8A4D2
MSKSKSKSNEHLVDWEENEHKTLPKETGCLWRHEEYAGTKWPRCNYRKNAHDHSKLEETGIYDIPTIRSPERWVQIWLEELGPSMQKVKGDDGKPLTNADGSFVKTETPGSRPASPDNGGWHLDKTGNFVKDKVPYWHNTHHVIACGEITQVFPDEREQRLLLKSRWNINEMPNVIILPKQETVARILKLPTHVPPEGKQNHNNYSTRLGTKLNDIKAKLVANGAQTGHELTDDTKEDCREELEKASKAIRDFLIEIGEKRPGIDIDSLTFDSVNW